MNPHGVTLSLGLFYSWVNWDPLSWKYLNSTYHRWIANNFKILSHLTLLEPKGERQYRKCPQPHSGNGRSASTRQVLWVLIHYFYKETTFKGRPMRSKWGTGKKCYWNSLRRGSLPVWAASVKKGWWMQALEGGLYSERLKGNGDTISDGKRSQRKVWGWTGTRYIWRSGSKSVGFEGGAIMPCKDLTMAGTGEPVWIMGRAWPDQRN